MPFYYLILGTLGVWRITHLLNAEAGPWDLFGGLRRLAGDGMAGELLDCFYCLSLWISAPFALALGPGWRAKLLLWPAFSAGAILAERLTTHTHQNAINTVTYFEQPEESHVLRTE
jgi:hypothetical protein